MNSRSEYSWCKVPRLKLDIEEWSKGMKKVSTMQEADIKSMESSGKEGDDQALMEDLEALETDARRMEMKRKGDEQGKKPREGNWRNWWDGVKQLRQDPASRKI